MYLNHPCLGLKVIMAGSCSKAEVVNGVGSWLRVESAMKDATHVICVVDFVSHDIMWRIKANKDKKTIYAKSNRILDQFLKVFGPELAGDIKVR